MTSSLSAREHWETVYGTPSQDLGWYEPEPSTLGLVTAHSSPTDSLIDVGGGDSRLVDNLLGLGYEDLTVLDIATVALDRTRSRLGARSSAVRWVHSDVKRFEPERTWDLWHDRAVFHFLVDEKQRDVYRAVLSRAVAPGGLLIVAAFGPGAPERCAGLRVVHYDVVSLTAAFAPDFEPIAVGRLDPARSSEGDQRPYVAGVFSNRSALPRKGT